MPALLKSSALARKVSKWERVTVREKEKRAREGAADRKWRAVSALVKFNAKGICQVSGVETRPSGDPRFIGQAHHIVYRSAGGADVLSNLLWVAGQIHDYEHRHLIEIRGTSARFTVTVHGELEPEWRNAIRQQVGV